MTHSARNRGRQPQCKKTKTVGLTKKSAALYAHHAFKVHFFGVQLHDYDVKPLNATFYTGREQTTTNFPVSFLNLDKVQENRLHHLTNLAGSNRHDKV